MATATGLPPLEELHRVSAKRTRALFASETGDLLLEEESRSASFGSYKVDLRSFLSSARIRLAVKINDEYRDYKVLPPPLLAQQGPVGPSRPAPDPARKMITSGGM